MYKIYESILKNTNVSPEDKNIISAFLAHFNKKKKNQEEEEINNQFMSILNNIENKDFINTFNQNIVEIVKKYFDVETDKISKHKFQFFENFLNCYETIFDSSVEKYFEHYNKAKKIPASIFKKIANYSPYTKNTDFIITEAFIQSLQIFPELVKDKNIKLTKPVGFHDGDNNEYTIDLLSKDELSQGVPMALGGITPCCLNFGATGGNFSLYSIFDENANFAVVKHKGKIISHALIWLDKDGKTLVIDSIDPTQQLYVKQNKELLENNGNLLTYLYNDLANQLLVDNPILKQVSMSLGGNTLATLNLNNCYKKNIVNEEYLNSLVDKIATITGWENKILVNKFVPKNGEIFLMDNFSIHENTYEFQMVMAKQGK